MYLAGFGPVNDGTPMNLYCMSGGGGGRTVDRRGSFLIFATGALIKADLAPLAARAAPAPRGAVRTPDEDAFAGDDGLRGAAAVVDLVDWFVGRMTPALGATRGLVPVAALGEPDGFVLGCSAFSGFLANCLTGPGRGFFAESAPGPEEVGLDFLERGSLLETFFFSARLGRAGMGRVNSL